MPHRGLVATAAMAVIAVAAGTGHVPFTSEAKLSSYHIPYLGAQRAAQCNFVLKAQRPEKVIERRDGRIIWLFSLPRPVHSAAPGKGTSEVLGSVISVEVLPECWTLMG